MVARNGTGLDDKKLTLFYSLTVSVFAIGGMVGSLMKVSQADCSAVYRKGTLVRITCLVFIAGAFMGFSRTFGSPEMIIVGRFITGVHSGISLSVVPMYLGEIAPKNLRGFLGLVPSIFICLGVFIAQILGLHELLGKEEHWPLFLSLVVIPTMFQLMLLPWFPESPRYLLIEKRNVHATITALKWYRSKANIQAEIEEMQEEQRSMSSVQTVSVIGLLKDRSIWFYTNAIFENAGIPVPQIQYTTVGTGAIEVIAGCVGCFIIERLGRRPLMIGGFTFMGICCAGITLSLMFQMSAGAYCYLVFFGVCMAVAAYVFFIVPETKNKTFVEISQMFAGQERHAGGGEQRAGRR
ncbi:unnamed protein product [Coregonus sp. 'balchen']|nr:unnamed protein product [Coregonus sp. 'balchen']